MTQRRVFVTRIIPDDGLEMITDFCDAEVWQDELPPPRETLLEKVQDIDGLLCLLTDPIDAAWSTATLELASLGPGCCGTTGTVPLVATLLGLGVMSLLRRRERPPS